MEICWFETNLKDNLQLLISAYTVYTDEYANGLDNPEQLADLFGFVMKRLWRFAVQYHLTTFFYKYHFFSTNELTSLFHFPDNTYNRSPIISWMEYKVLPAPANLMRFETNNGYIFTVDGNTTVILTTDGDYYKYLKQMD